ncbi:hypothetical protein TSAR_010861 [Trichomalopsis sarcophagae]|uniref:Uncharacterized protein n=1 Tax=Trichomalopsis sarcophagae TaxID=543379 RepID=A0A232EI63_9HYME|nr:hypothetical protein TSAR_010861 [Trichomalopsis sarcophagae]
MNLKIIIRNHKIIIEVTTIEEEGTKITMSTKVEEEVIIKPSQPVKKKAAKTLKVIPILKHPPIENSLHHAGHG